jgi:hypothetical protein
MFHLFAGDRYNPSGGVGDLKGTYGTLDEAVEAATVVAKDPSYDWWHITDRDLKIVKEWCSWDTRPA